MKFILGLLIGLSFGLSLEFLILTTTNDSEDYDIPVVLTTEQLKELREHPTLGSDRCITCDHDSDDPNLRHY